nr:MAG TPA: hypothetical protein [Caudoviricetes sp.]DAV45923.1 MAG TPA: hypothetical protein [Caudoviricetes sp.]
MQRSRASNCNHRPDHGQKLAEGGKQEQFSQRVRRSFIEKSASEQSGAIFIPKSRKD